MDPCEWCGKKAERLAVEGPHLCAKCGDDAERGRTREDSERCCRRRRGRFRPWRPYDCARCGAETRTRSAMLRDRCVCSLECARDAERAAARPSPPRGPARRPRVASPVSIPESPVDELVAIPASQPDPDSASSSCESESESPPPGEGAPKRARPPPRDDGDESSVTETETEELPEELNVSPSPPPDGAERGDEAEQQPPAAPRWTEAHMRELERSVRTAMADTYHMRGDAWRATSLSQWCARPLDLRPVPGARPWPETALLLSRASGPNLCTLIPGEPELECAADEHGARMLLFGGGGSRSLINVTARAASAAAMRGRWTPDGGPCPIMAAVQRAAGGPTRDVPPGPVNLGWARARLRCIRSGKARADVVVSSALFAYRMAPRFWLLSLAGGRHREMVNEPGTGPFGRDIAATLRAARNAEADYTLDDCFHV